MGCGGACVCVVCVCLRVGRGLGVCVCVWWGADRGRGGRRDPASAPAHAPLPQPETHKPNPQNDPKSLSNTLQTTKRQPNQGFLVNRVLIPMVNEAFFCLMEGVGSAEDIDKGMRLGTNQPMGPLRLADFIGALLFGVGFGLLRFGL